MEFAEKEKKKSNSKNPVTQKQRGIFSGGALLVSAISNCCVKDNSLRRERVDGREMTGGSRLKWSVTGVFWSCISMTNASSSWQQPSDSSADMPQVLQEVFLFKQMNRFHFSHAVMNIQDPTHGAETVYDNCYGK